MFYHKKNYKKNKNFNDFKISLKSKFLSTNFKFKNKFKFVKKEFQITYNVMKKIFGLIQARMGSSRLPGKVMLLL